MAAKSCQYRVRPAVARPASSLINRNLRAVGTALSLKKTYPMFSARVLVVLLSRRTRRPQSSSELASGCGPAGFGPRWPGAFLAEGRSQAPELAGLSDSSGSTGAPPLGQPGQIFTTFSRRPKVFTTSPRRTRRCSRNKYLVWRPNNKNKFRPLSCNSSFGVKSAFQPSWRKPFPNPQPQRILKIPAKPRGHGLIFFFFFFE